MSILPYKFPYKYHVSFIPPNIDMSYFQFMSVQNVLDFTFWIFFDPWII